MPAWKKPFVVGKSIPGESHIKHKLPCQDEFAFKTTDDHIVMAVADGVGSSPKSDIGAQMAVNHCIDHVLHQLKQPCEGDYDYWAILMDAFKAARKKIELEAILYNCSIHDYASTLIAVVMHNRSIWCAHLADGAVVIQTDDAICVLSKPTNFEYENMVIPLTSDLWEQNIRFTEQRDTVTGVAMFTDGCQKSTLYHENKVMMPYEKFFIPLFDYFRKNRSKASDAALAQLLQSTKFSSVSNDDRTMLICVLPIHIPETEAGSDKPVITH